MSDKVRGKIILGDKVAGNYIVGDKVVSPPSFSVDDVIKQTELSIEEKERELRELRAVLSSLRQM